MIRHLSLLLLVSLAVLLPARPSIADARYDSVMALPPGQINWDAVPEYRMVPGDELRVNFGPNPNALGDLVRDVTVRPDGRITVFPIGDVVAAGRTPRELEAAIVQLLSAEFRQPRVTIEVSKLAANQIHVLGRVKRPGSIEAGTFLTVVQAITAAGGFEDDASRNSVLVFHRDGPRNVRVARVPVDRMLKNADLTLDLPLSRYDIVYVPRSTIGNIDVFARQFFGEPSQILSAAMLGWELFNLDRVFVVSGGAR